MASFLHTATCGSDTCSSPSSPESQCFNGTETKPNGNDDNQQVPSIDIDKTVFEALDPHEAKDSLEALRNSGVLRVLYPGLWSYRAVKEGIRLPTDAIFLDEYVAQNYTTRYLLALRDRYITKLRRRLPKWLKLLESNDGWKYHGTKNGTIFHRREPKRSAPMIKGTHNFGTGVTLKEVNDICAHKDYFYNLRVKDGSLKHFRPCAIWGGARANPWMLSVSWQCFSGFPPIVSDRDVLVASLLLQFDTHTTVTICSSIKSHCIKFPERPKHAVSFACRAIYMIREDETRSLHYSGIMQAAMKLLVPQFIYIRSHLFTQPVDFSIVKKYVNSEEGRASIGQSPVSEKILMLGAEQINYRHLWIKGGGGGGDTHSTYDDMEDVMSEDDGDNDMPRNYSHLDAYQNWDHTALYNTEIF